MGRRSGHPLDSLTQYAPYTVCHTLCDDMGTSMGETDLYETLRLELRRGSLVMAVLARLRTEQYGYSLRVALGQDGLEMEESTLYPLLRRLESQGLLDSEWREEERRKKRFYRLSVAAAAALADDGADALAHRAEVDRYVRRIGDQAAARVEQGAGEVEPLLDVHRVGGGLQRETHAFSHGHEPAVEQL